jgi:hypothetical protein
MGGRVNAPEDPDQPRPEESFHRLKDDGVGLTIAWISIAEKIWLQVLHPPTDFEEVLSLALRHKNLEFCRVPMIGRK